VCVGKLVRASGLEPSSVIRLICVCVRSSGAHTQCLKRQWTRVQTMMPSRKLAYLIGRTGDYMTGWTFLGVPKVSSTDEEHDGHEKLLHEM